MTQRGPVDRRRFLAGTAGAMGAAFFGRFSLGAMAEQGAPPAAQGWDAGLVRHLLPTVSDSRMLLKVSFDRPLSAAPTLRVGTTAVAGRMNDTVGECWQFYAADLDPARRYSLSLAAADGTSLCEPWDLSTFPSPDARPERLRMLFFTCAGGPGGSYSGIGQRSGFLPTAIRNRLLRRALSFAPDAAVANGDHIYWDLHTWQGRERRRAERARTHVELRFLSHGVRGEQRNSDEGGRRAADRSGVRNRLSVDPGLLPPGRPRPLGERCSDRRDRKFPDPVGPVANRARDPAALLIPRVLARYAAPGRIALVVGERSRGFVRELRDDPLR